MSQVVESPSHLSYSRDFLLQFSSKTKVDPVIVEKLTPYISPTMKQAKRGTIPQKSPYTASKTIGDQNKEVPSKRRLAKTPNPRKADVAPLGQVLTEKKPKNSFRESTMMSPLQLKFRTKQNFSDKENIPQTNTQTTSNYESGAKPSQVLKEANVFRPALSPSSSFPSTSFPSSFPLSPSSLTKSGPNRLFSPRRTSVFQPAQTSSPVPALVVTEPALQARESTPQRVAAAAGSDSLEQQKHMMSPISASKSQYPLGTPSKSFGSGTPVKSPTSALSPSKSPTSPKSPNRPISPLDEQRLMQRQKQIDYGYRTVGYLRYRLLIAKDQRKAEHPRTPKKTQGCSKRSWDGQLKKWRRDLHLWDPDNVDAFRAMLNSDLVVSIIAANPELAEIVDIVREKMDNPTSPTDDSDEISAPALEDSMGFSDANEKKVSPSRIGNDPNFHRVARALVF